VVKLAGGWGADAGIDLIAEDRDGRLWATQAKTYAASYAIKKADVDSFLSESSRPQFSFGLLIVTIHHLAIANMALTDCGDRHGHHHQRWLGIDCGGTSTGGSL